MILILLVTVLVLCCVLWRFTGLKGHLPPLAEGALPIVGHTFSVLGNRDRLYDIVLEKMLGSSLRRGNEAATIRCGAWNVYTLMNPDDAYALCNSCLEKDPIYEFFRPVMGDGLINAHVHTWKKHRKLINPTFNQAVLEGYLVEFNRESRSLVRDLAKEAGGGPFDQLPYVKHSSLLMILATAMGASSNQEVYNTRVAIGKYYEAFTDCMVERSRRFWYHNDFIFSLSSLQKKQNAMAKKIGEYTEQVVRQRKEDYKACQLKDPNKRFRAFLDLLLDLAEEGALTDQEIQDEVNTFFAAGSDTTAHVLCIALLVLGSYPDVQKKVVEELHEVFSTSDRDVEKHDLSKLKYLEAVIKETMRLYPIITLIGRNVTEDLKLRQYVLPAGSRCFVSVYNLGRHSLWGTDATQFRPERWLDTDTLPKSHVFAVFGLSKRTCIGSNYAMMSMKTTLAHLMRHYHVTGDVTNLVQRLDIIVRPVSGYHISIESRKKKPNAA